MNLRCLGAALVLLVCWMAWPSGTSAQTTLAVGYSAGWNMAGGPSGLDLSGAQALYIYSSGGYVEPSSATTSPCQGYWAYFAAPATLLLKTSSTGLQTCPLQVGWNIVGDPFAGPALLPSAMIGYTWDGGKAQYAPVVSIPPGGAVWIYTDTAGSLALQDQGGSTG